MRQTKNHYRLVSEIIIGFISETAQTYICEHSKAPPNFIGSSTPTDRRRDRGSQRMQCPFSIRCVLTKNGVIATQMHVTHNCGAPVKRPWIRIRPADLDEQTNSEIRMMIEARGRIQDIARFVGNKYSKQKNDGVFYHVWLMLSLGRSDLRGEISSTALVISRLTTTYS